MTAGTDVVARLRDQRERHAIILPRLRGRAYQKKRLRVNDLDKVLHALEAGVRFQ